MQTPVNPFKQALANKQAQIGLWLSLADPYATEISAGAGFDWLLVDGEHAPNDVRSLLAQLQAIAPYPSHPIARVPMGHGHVGEMLIKQYLDVGVQTLLVPMVDTPQQAAALVRASRYPVDAAGGTQQGGANAGGERTRSTSSSFDGSAFEIGEGEAAGLRRSPFGAKKAEPSIFSPPSRSSARRPKLSACSVRRFSGDAGPCSTDGLLPIIRPLFSAGRSPADDPAPAAPPAAELSARLPTPAPM